MYEPRTDKHRPRKNKICIVCQKEYLPVTGLQKRCKNCRISDSERSRDYYFRNRDTKLARQRKYYQDNKEVLRPKKTAYARIWSRKNSVVIRIRSARRKQMMASRRREMFHEILGDRCAECGFSDKRALQIDHINGGGYKETVRFGSTELMYDYYLGNPSECRLKLQILCANCNWIKRAERVSESRANMKHLH